MSVKLDSKIAGRFRLTTHGGQRGEIDHGWIDNLILDQGIAFLLNNGDYAVESYGFLRVGSGSSAPLVTQASLDSVVAVAPVKGTKTVGYNPTGGYQWTRFVYQFGQGVAQGNLSEIGSGWGAGATQLFSRALIVDGSGNPTTITVLADEYLTVTYELRRWWMPANDEVIAYDDDGTPASTTVISNKTPTDAELGNGAPWFAYVDFGVPTSYDRSTASQGYITATLSWGTDSGNPQISGLNTTANATNASRVFVPRGNVFTFNPPIPKTNEFSVQMDVVLSLSRYAP
tara:strand:+ start:40949 stop:41809 length:861 start_codon:yes stop_codon:yes gene_type:complete